jgi:2-C-methyl-D-erythritol 4-phosphate cytidylyltransferase
MSDKVEFSMYTVVGIALIIAISTLLVSPGLVSQDTEVEDMRYESETNTVHVTVETTEGINSTGEEITIVATLEDQETIMTHNAATNTMTPQVVEDTIIEESITRQVNPSSEYTYQIEFDDPEQKVDDYSVHIEE